MRILYAFRVAQHDTLRFLAGECFFCPLGDEIAFDLGRESECKRENL